jgi:hypothetical protein
MVQGFGLFSKPAAPAKKADSVQTAPTSAPTPAASPVASDKSKDQPAESLSGRQWVSAFRTGSDLDSLADAFRGNCSRFVIALRGAGASVSIAATLRAPERAYLMHYCFRIAREGLDPSTVPAMKGVNIQWVHPDLASSRSAAEQMVQGFHIVYKPALKSRHTQGLAIDMTISWQGNLSILDGNRNTVKISTSPRSGDNKELQEVGASYGVIKLASDPPHWSSDGH